MIIKLMKSKIHRATVTGADLNYEGSIALDEALIEAAGFVVGESVHVWNISNGERFETYVIRAPRGSGEVRLNGAAARLVALGDLVIVVSFCWVEPAEAEKLSPRVVLVDEKNRVTKAQ
jgi:aspartate 1-decarboxylase